MFEVNYSLENECIMKLIDEIERGLIKKDILPNSSYEMSGEREAMYFSHVRDNMKTSFAHLLMENV